MINEQWGVGSAKDAKAFDTVIINGHKFDLIFGEHAHSRQDNTMYVRDKAGRVEGFNGHWRCFKIEIEEYNYMKESELSGDEVRKGGTAKLFIDGVQCYEHFCRNYEMGYNFIQNFITKMEMNWDWYPRDVNSKIGKAIGYREQLFKIKSVDIHDAAMTLETIDGKNRKRFINEDEEDLEEIDNTIRTSIIDEKIDWYPRSF